MSSGSKRLIVYQKGLNQAVGVVCGCYSRADAGVSTSGNDEIEVNGDSTKWADVGVCALTSSEVGGNDSGDGAGARLRCATGSRWKTRWSALERLRTRILPL